MLEKWLSFHKQIRYEASFISLTKVPYMILPVGSIINAAAIIVGGGIGLLLGSRLPERIRQIVFQGLGLCVIVIGLQMAFVMKNPVVVIFSVLFGAVIGEALDIEAILTRGANALKARIHTKNPRFTEGLVGASVLFCIGSMAILGPFAEGLRGDMTILLTKSILDGFCSIALAAAMGVGVLFSALPILIYQGALTVFASFLQPYLSATVMNELTATGGILVLGIGINLLDIKTIRLANMLPALLFVVFLAHFFG